MPALGPWKKRGLATPVKRTLRRAMLLTGTGIGRTMHVAGGRSRGVFMDKMMGGDVIARMLKAEGVEKVFGIIDGTYFGLYSSLRKYDIDLITPRHETSAAHMAGAYARITGKLGVCMASNGPGVANILPGIAVENGEGNRVLLLTSTRRTGTGYPDRGGTYQYFNQVGVIKPMAKWSGAVPSHARLPELMRRAFRKSFHGRPGVVHVDVPENIMNGEEAAPAFLDPHQYRRTDPITPCSAQIEAAADLLLKAGLPIIHAGSGVVHAMAFAELQELAELLQAPVLTSWAAQCVAGRPSAGDSDDPRRAQSSGAERRGRGAHTGIAAGRNGLVGQGAILASGIATKNDSG